MLNREARLVNPIEHAVRSKCALSVEGLTALKDEPGGRTKRVGTIHGWTFKSLLHLPLRCRTKSCGKLSPYDGEDL